MVDTLLIDKIYLDNAKSICSVIDEANIRERAVTDSCCEDC